MAIIEVGLGGKNDSTNVVHSPLLILSYFSNYKTVHECFLLFNYGKHAHKKPYTNISFSSPMNNLKCQNNKAVNGHYFGAIVQIKEPVVCGITSLGMDHMGALGVSIFHVSLDNFNLF